MILVCRKNYDFSYVSGYLVLKLTRPLYGICMYKFRSMGEQFTVHYSDLNLQAELPPDSVYPIGNKKIIYYPFYFYERLTTSPVAELVSRSHRHGV